MIIPPIVIENGQANNSLIKLRTPRANGFAILRSCHLSVSEFRFAKKKLSETEWDCQVRSAVPEMLNQVKDCKNLPLWFHRKLWKRLTISLDVERQQKDA